MIQKKTMVFDINVEILFFYCLSTEKGLYLCASSINLCSYLHILKGQSRKRKECDAFIFQKY